MSAAMTALIGEPARRPPTYPAIIGPAGWIHHSRNERIRMTREEDQNENGGPSRWKRPASLSTSMRYTPGVWDRARVLVCRRRRGGSSSSSSLARRGQRSHPRSPLPIPSNVKRTFVLRVVTGLNRINRVGPGGEVTKDR